MVLYFSAICYYSPAAEDPQCLPLKVGETVHILEQFGEGSTGKIIQLTPLWQSIPEELLCKNEFLYNYKDIHMTEKNLITSAGLAPKCVFVLK